MFLESNNYALLDSNNFKMPINKNNLFLSMTSNGIVFNDF